MKHVKNFVLRGLMASGFGPLILAVIYLILQKNGVMQTVTVDEICLGIFTSAALAFVAGAANGVYHIERLPLMLAIWIHGCVLYGAYLAVYLVNGWLAWGKVPVLVFSGIFVAGYLVTWAVIYAVDRKKIARVNRALQQRRSGDRE